MENRNGFINIMGTCLININGIIYVQRRNRGAMVTLIDGSVLDLDDIDYEDLISIIGNEAGIVDMKRGVHDDFK